jgi:hypothetical protein
MTQEESIKKFADSTKIGPSSPRGTEKQCSLPWTLCEWANLWRMEFNVPGVYILENTPTLGGEISADVIWQKKYEKWKRKRGKM